MEHDENLIIDENYEARSAYRDGTVASLYDNVRFKSLRGRIGNWLDRRALNLALACLPQSEGLILDVPCGTGRITSMIVAAGYTAIAADVSLEMINVARNRFANSPAAPLGSVQTDAAYLPFPDGGVVCATAIRFMGHIPSDIRVEILRELARVSNKHVIVDFSVSHPFTNMRRWIESSLKTKNWGFKKNWHWQVISKHQLDEEFRAAGLQAVRWFPKARGFSDASIVLLERNDDR